MIVSILQFFFMFSYVSGNNSFPKKLSPEDEKKYLTLYKEGSEEARNILIESNLRLVAHIVKKYSNYSKENEDMISVGTIGLIKGISTFNMDKGTRLATYVARCIENEILMSIRASKKYAGDIYLQDPIGIDREGNEIAMIDIIEAENDEIVEQVDLKMQAVKLYEKMKHVLKGREKTIIELRYGLANGCEKTQREIADMLGISRSYVSRIEKKALKKLYKEMKE